MKRRPDHLPNSAEAEAGILGGVLLRNEALALAPDLEVEDFYDHKNKVVFQGIRNLEAAGLPIDVVTLENEIAKAGKLDAIGGVAYLGELTLRVPTTDNVEAYVGIVIDKRITRQVILTLSEIIDSARLGAEGAEGSEGEQLCHDVSSAMMSIRTRHEDPIVTMGELIAREAKQAISDSEARLAGQRVYAGVPTGFTALDHLTGGTPVGIPTLVIGRPGNGKTTIAMALAQSGRRVEGMDSLLVSYEDGGQSFGQRGLAQEGDLSTQLIRARRLDRDAIIEATAAWAASAVRTESFLSASGMTVEALVRRVRRENIRRRMKGRPALKQVLVDYVQKMPGSPGARTREEEISHISRTLSSMAVREDCALVEFAQLNREVEKRDDHRPRLSDIRESGSLEQDGKLILGLYLPHRYEPRAKNPDTGQPWRPSDLKIIVLKNAQGEADIDINLFWAVKSHAVYDSELDYQQARILRRAGRPDRGGIDFAKLAEETRKKDGAP